jgi:hypothetical protein
MLVEQSAGGASVDVLEATRHEIRQASTAFDEIPWFSHLIDQHSAYLRDALDELGVQVTDSAQLNALIAMTIIYNQQIAVHHQDEHEATFVALLLSLGRFIE